MPSVQTPWPDRARSIWCQARRRRSADCSFRIWEWRRKLLSSNLTNLTIKSPPSILKSSRLCEASRKASRLYRSVVGHASWFQEMNWSQLKRSWEDRSSLVSVVLFRSVVVECRLTMNHQQCAGSRVAVDHGHSESLDFVALKVTIQCVIQFWYRKYRTAVNSPLLRRAQGQQIRSYFCSPTQFSTSL